MSDHMQAVLSNIQQQICSSRQKSDPRAPSVYSGILSLYYKITLRNPHVSPGDVLPEIFSGCAVLFLKPSFYFRPKYAIFNILLHTIDSRINSLLRTTKIIKHL